MSSNQSIPANFAVPIEVEPLIDKYIGVLKTGVSVKMKVRRKSDNLVLDWSDSTFKSLGSVAQLLSAAFQEVDATAFPGEYYSSLALDTLVPANTHDVYMLTIIEDGTSVVGNLPQTGAIRVEQAMTDAILTRQAMWNNHDLSEGNANNLELWNDDNSAVIGRWSVKDKDSLGISIPAGFPARRVRTL